MRKYWILIHLLTTLLFMVSCGSHDVPPTTHPTSVPSESECTEAVTEVSTESEITVAPASDPAALSDYDLFETVYLQTLDLVYSYPSESAAMENMTEAQRVFYVLSLYDMEMQNGGLCQFFVNSSCSVASDVEFCLEIVGADAHKDLFVDFIETNQINTSVLDSFVIYDIEDYIEQTQRFDFDSFDMAYYELPPLFDYLVAYIRNNVHEF